MQWSSFAGIHTHPYLVVIPPERSNSILTFIYIVSPNEKLSRYQYCLYRLSRHTFNFSPTRSYFSISDTHKIVCVYAQPLSCVRLFCDPKDCVLPGFSVHGILQARILEWAAIYPPNPGIAPVSPTLTGRFFSIKPPGKSNT